MDQVIRIGVSLEPELLNQFDDTIKRKGYVSRSEAIRDLVRDSLAENDWKNDNMEMVGAIMIIVDTTVNNTFERIDAVTRKWSHIVQFVNSINLDFTSKMEMIAVKGKLCELKDLSSDLMATKGVHRAKLTMAAPTTGNIHYIGLRN